MAYAGEEETGVDRRTILKGLTGIGVPVASAGCLFQKEYNPDVRVTAPEEYSDLRVSLEYQEIGNETYSETEELGSDGEGLFDNVPFPEDGTAARVSLVSGDGTVASELFPASEMDAGETAEIHLEPDG